MKRNVRIFAIVLAVLLVVASLSAALVGCNNKDDDEKGGITPDAWRAAIEAFTEASGGTDEVDVIITNLSAFTYADGKYTASQLALSNGFTMYNIVVVMENGAVKNMTYELRTESPDTPDRRITIDSNGVSSEDIPKPSDNTQTDEDVSISSEEWRAAIEAFTEASGSTDEVDVIITNLSAFTYADGKYKADQLALSNGFTMYNIVVVMENGAVKNMTYELRTEALDTPDRVITIDSNGVNSEDVPKPSDNTQMGEDEWAEQVEIFANVTNYTLARTRGGAIVGAMKLDGFNYYDIADDRERVFTTDGTKYYRYGKATDESVWTRREVDVDSYLAAVGTPAEMVGVAAQMITTGFSEFAFNAGIYTTDELYMEVAGYEVTLRDIKVTISGKAIVKVTCIYVGGYDDNGDELITVDHVGSTVVTVPTNYNEVAPPEPQPPTPPSTEELTAEQWAIAVNEFAGSTNFTTVGKQAYAATITRRSGDTIYMEHIGGDHTHDTEYAGTIYAKDGDEFIKWTQQKPIDQWTRSTITEAEYNEQFDDAAEMTAMVSETLGDKYDLFTYAEGVYYTDKNIEVDANIYLANMQLVVGKGSILRVSFSTMYRTQQGDKNMGDYVIYDIGSTLAFDPNDVDSISGKTFLFDYLYTAYGIDPDSQDQNDQLAMMRAQNEGTRITFGSDRSFHYESGDDAMAKVIMTGTWAQEGAIITVAITSVTIDGVAQDMSTAGTTEYIFSYNNFELTHTLLNEGDLYYYSIYARQD